MWGRVQHAAIQAHPCNLAPLFEEDRDAFTLCRRIKVQTQTDGDAVSSWVLDKAVRQVFVCAGVT